MRKLIFATLFLAACGGSSETPAPSTPAPAPAAAPAPTEAPAAAPAADAPAEGGDATADAAGAGDDEGAKVYNQYCIACHQADGKGMNGTLAGDFTSGRLAEKTDDELLTSIREGFTGKVGAMPAWKGVLSDDQMKAVLAYVKKTYTPAG